MRLRRSRVKERRVHPRYDTEVPVTLRTRGKLIPAATLNLSKSGICVLTDYNEEISEGLVEVVLDLSPQLRDVSIRGTILRFQKGIGQKVAIQFNTTNPSQGYKALEKFLTNRYN